MENKFHFVVFSLNRRSIPLIKKKKKKRKKAIIYLSYISDKNCLEQLFRVEKSSHLPSIYLRRDDIVEISWRFRKRFVWRGRAYWMTRVFQTKEAVRQKANRPARTRMKGGGERRNGVDEIRGDLEEAKRERCGPLLTE